MATKQLVKIWVNGSGGIYRTSTSVVWYKVALSTEFNNSAFWYHVSMGQVGFKTTALAVHKYRLK